MDTVKVLEKGMEKSKKENNNSFIAFRGMVDRLTSHTIVERDQEGRRLNLNILFFLQVYDEYLDQELNTVTAEEVSRQIDNNNQLDEETPESLYRTIVEVVEPIEYRDLISDNNRNQINQRTWFSAVEQYFERLDASNQQITAVKRIGEPILNNVIQRMDREINKEIENLISEIKKCDTDEEMIELIQSKIVEIDSDIRYLGQV